MKNKIILLFFLFSSFIGVAQPVINRTFGTNTVNDPRLSATLNLLVPRYNDTTAANSNIGVDSCSALIFTYSDNSYWLRACSPKRWVKLLKTGDVSDVTADNGLTKTGSNIQLGGALTQNTTIDAGSPYNLAITANGSVTPFRITHTGSGNGIFINTFSGTGSAISAQSNNATTLSALAFGTGYGASIVSTSNIGMYAATTSGPAGIAVDVNPSSTNTSQTILQLKRYTSGTAENNISGRIEFITEPASGTVDVTSGYIESGWEDATFATRKSFMALYTTFNGSTTRKSNISSSGQWTWDGYPALATQVDTTAYKPVAINMTTGEVVPFGGWSGVGISGSGVANQITYWTGASTVGGDAGMTVNATTNTIITDTTRLLQLVVAGDSTVTSKIVFSPIKPRPGPMPWRIGLDEQNNQYNGGATIDPVFEIKYGALDGTGRYMRTAWEGSWLPFPGATYEQAEIHVLEMGYGPSLGNLIVRPLAWTGSWSGDDGTWTHRANLHSFYDWNGQKDLGGFSRGVGEFKAYYNYTGSANVRMLVKDTGTLINVAGFGIEGQIAAGIRNATTTHYGQSITQQFETGPVFRSNKGGQGYSSGWNYVFNILDTNTNHMFIFTKGSGLFDNVYAWMHNDGRFVSGDAGFFFPQYKFQAKPQGVNPLAFVAGDYDASNNTILRLSSFAHGLTSGSGGGAAGMGAGFDFRADNSSNTLTAIADIAAAWNGTPTAGAENGDLLFRVKNNGSMVPVATFSTNGNITFGTTNSIVGTATNNNAVAGNIGEYISSTVTLGSAVALSTTVTANVTSISLTAGDWDVTGVVDYAMTTATVTNFQHGASTTSATLGAQDTYLQKEVAFAGASATYADPVPITRISIASTTTVYLVAQATFSGGSVGAYGTIRARRVR